MVGIYLFRSLYKYITHDYPFVDDFDKYSLNYTKSLLEEIIERPINEDLAKRVLKIDEEIMNYNRELSLNNKIDKMIFSPYEIIKQYSQKTKENRVLFIEELATKSEDLLPSIRQIDNFYNNIIEKIEESQYLNNSLSIDFIDKYVAN